MEQLIGNEYFYCFIKKGKTGDFMALIKCVECGKDISDTTDICIHCGAPTSFSLQDHGKVNNRLKRHNKHGIFIFLGVFILFFIILVILFFTNSAHKGTLSSSTLNAEYSAPKYEYAFGDAMREIFKFKDDGKVVYQLCNVKTNACADPRSYTYEKYGSDVKIYSYGSVQYNCFLKDSDKILRCNDTGGTYQDYAKTN